jgi:hypothetical protein
VAGAVAVDGKTLRGSGHHPSPRVHLLAAMDHTSRAVLAQADVDGTTNEIPQFQPLLDGVELSGAVIPPTRSTPSTPTPTGWSASSTPPTCCS